jgi:spore maturation protein CgeB
MATCRLDHYDGVLASGEVISRQYLARGWAERVWTWREAADHRVFRPVPGQRLEGDLIWIGNWGEQEPRPELEEFLVAPSEALGLRTRVHGIRYPPAALERLAQAGIEYGGWIPNFALPMAFARFRMTVHAPPSHGVETLPGIPAIRLYEALACGIPLVCSPWEDRERLFTVGRDYLVARDGGEMRRVIRRLMTDESAARSLADHGRRTILTRHTCVHRVNDLLEIVAELNRTRRKRTVAGTG